MDGCPTDGRTDGCSSSDGEAEDRKSQAAPKGTSTPTLHFTKVFFFSSLFSPPEGGWEGGEGGQTNFHQVDVFQHKKPQLAITGKNYRTCNRPNDTWKTDDRRD